jgi:adenine-specific DNA-methyltransferase
MKIFKKIEQTLLKNKDFVSEDGSLKKWVIINKAKKLDEQLISLLLDDEEIKETFFNNIKNSIVFNQNKFITFLEQKNFLEDSYTSFKSKVGLKIGNKYLNQINDISLAWPYKDCILEGGQSNEDIKRDEIFFNELLAQDEITQLCEPKVFSECFFIDKSGELKLEKTFQRDENGLISDNLLIEANNFIALNSIKNQYREKIQLIYIDPPYNTGGDANIFTYNNTFNHSTWLTFMKNRLSISKDLLSKNGFIAIAIDHFELGYLIVLADEIFGRENRIGIISVVNNPMGRQNAKFFSNTTEYMLVYAKDVSLAKFNHAVIDEDKLKDFKYTDKNGNYKLNSFLHDHKKGLRESKPNNWYPIYISKDCEKISLKHFSNSIELFPINKSKIERSWMKIKKSFEEDLNNGLIVAKKIKDSYEIYYKYYEKQRIPTHWVDKKYNSNHQGKRLLEKIVGENNFSFPKAVGTVKDTIKILSSENDIVLDFFAGSGTTAHAVLEINEEQNSNRKFILIEQLENHIKVSLDRLKEIIPKYQSDFSFKYLKIKKYNEKFIKKINAAKDDEKLSEILEQMKKRSFIDYNLDFKKLEENYNEYRSLNLNDKKIFLFDILDKNQLYVNFSSIDDNEFKCSDSEKELTYNFYDFKI